MRARPLLPPESRLSAPRPRLQVAEDEFSGLGRAGLEPRRTDALNLNYWRRWGAICGGAEARPSKARPSTFSAPYATTV